MYTHLFKGMHVGQALFRRVARGCTGFGGFLLDAIFLAPFCGGKQFWTEEEPWKYADETPQVGVMQPILGWVGDIPGAIVGGVIGGAIGIACYIPDAILRSVCWAHRKISTGFDDFAKFIGERESFKDIAYQNPNTYLKKAWNISTAILGFIVALPLVGTAKILEFFLPIGKTLSNSVWKFSGYLGGLIGITASIAAAPALYCVKKALRGYEWFRGAVRSLTAIVYAKTANKAPEANSHLAVGLEESTTCLAPAMIHSEKFRDKVTTYHPMSTGKIFFGGALPGIAAAQPLIAAAPPVAIAAPIRAAAPGGPAVVARTEVQPAADMRYSHSKP